MRVFYLQIQHFKRIARNTPRTSRVQQALETVTIVSSTIAAVEKGKRRPRTAAFSSRWADVANSWSKDDLRLSFLTGHFQEPELFTLDGVSLSCVRDIISLNWTRDGDLGWCGGDLMSSHHVQFTDRRTVGRVTRQGPHGEGC